MNNFQARGILAASLTVALLTLAACGSDDDTTPATGSDATGGTATGSNGTGTGGGGTGTGGDGTGTGGGGTGTGGDGTGTGGGGTGTGGDGTGTGGGGTGTGGDGAGSGGGGAGTGGGGTGTGGDGGTGPILLADTYPAVLMTCTTYNSPSAPSGAPAPMPPFNSTVYYVNRGFFFNPGLPNGPELLQWPQLGDPFTVIQAPSGLSATVTAPTDNTPMVVSADISRDGQLIKLTYTPVAEGSDFTVCEPVN